MHGHREKTMRGNSMSFSQMAHREGRHLQAKKRNASEETKPAYALILDLQFLEL